MKDPDSILWPIVSTLIFIGEILVCILFPKMRDAAIPGAILAAIIAAGMIWHYVRNVLPKKTK